MKKHIFNIVAFLLFSVMLFSCANDESAVTVLTMIPETALADITDMVSAPSDVGEFTYVLNTSTKKIHLPACKSAAQIKEENKKGTDRKISDLTAEGYSVCKLCIK